jgi:DNA-binding winged helix-turn-helix (wHTH) protein
MNTPRVTSFDGWVLRADIGELDKDGRKIRLQQLPLLVLQELLAHPGELVTREQLIARLWPKGVVDFDTGLNTAVRKLRVALEDIGEVPRYIETIPRRGYRFIGAVDPPGDVVTPAAPAVVPIAAQTPPPPVPVAENDPTPAVERRTAERREAASAGTTTATRPGAASPRRGVAIAAGVLLLLVAAGATWWAQRPSQAAGHGMTVRLSGFDLLSTDLPATLPETVNAEITAAFSIDGVVGVSSASAPTPGTAPAFTLGGTIQREGQTIRVITQMINERSGVTLWSKTSNYDGNEVSRVPRHIAVDVGNVVRCGLFGASTYHKPLPDGVLRDYMQFCEGHWDPNVQDGRKALVPAQRVVAAVPDFSWGGRRSPEAIGKWRSARTAAGSQRRLVRAAGRQPIGRSRSIPGTAKPCTSSP